jgi:2-polyprenyl-3-methyl-5-hydroxy-6-metoxy-1,4-benzoquinol methylase
LHSLLPKKGNMLHIGCGYGFITYLMHFAAKERTITGIDTDEDKIEVADKCLSKDDGINFIHADATQFAFEKYDAIILAGVLNHLQPEDQLLLFEKCITSLHAKGSLLIKINKGTQHKYGINIFGRFVPDELVNLNEAPDVALSNPFVQSAKDIAAKHHIKWAVTGETAKTSGIVLVMTKE